MLKELFDEVLNLSAKLRQEYPASLGRGSSNWEDVILSIDTNIPTLFESVYSKVSGTKREVERQELLDFIPGYRLIHIDELIDEKVTFDEVYAECISDEVQTVIPFLANYSSDFICYCRMLDGKDTVCSITHDAPKLVIMHENAEKFLVTICEFYKKMCIF